MFGWCYADGGSIRLLAVRCTAYMGTCARKHYFQVISINLNLLSVIVFVLRQLLPYRLFPPRAQDTNWGIGGLSALLVATSYLFIDLVLILNICVFGFWFILNVLYFLGMGLISTICAWILVLNLTFCVCILASGF